MYRDPAHMHSVGLGHQHVWHSMRLLLTKSQTWADRQHALRAAHSAGPAPQRRHSDHVLGGGVAQIGACVLVVPASLSRLGPIRLHHCLSGARVSSGQGRGRVFRFGVMPHRGGQLPADRRAAGLAKRQAGRPTETVGCWGGHRAQRLSSPWWFPAP